MSPIFVFTLGDVLGIVVVVLVAGAWLSMCAVNWWRHGLCKHDGGVSETNACEAICRKCGKNLGFIGNWRKSHVD